jgi:hypothetical protein
MTEWMLEYLNTDLVITGPGQLQIVLQEFDPDRLRSDHILPPEVLGDLQQGGWSYELEPGVTLQLISTRSRHHPGSALHVLHVGRQVSWTLPAEFGAQLGRLKTYP